MPFMHWHVKFTNDNLDFATVKNAFLQRNQTIFHYHLICKANPELQIKILHINPEYTQITSSQSQ